MNEPGDIRGAGRVAVTLADFFAGWNAMLRSQFALILREARMRHGRSRVGYAWAVLEPFAIILLLTLFFSGALRGGPLHPEVAVFYATGVLPFKFYRHASSFIGLSLEANAPLFSYPTVRELDAVLARLVLETVTSLLIMTLVFASLMAIFDLPGPAHLETMLIAFAGLALLALGVGLNVATLQRRFQMTHHVYNMIMTPAFFLSCVFFSLNSVPAEFRNVLAWNPVVHGVEGFRLGYFKDYGDQYLSLGYLYLFGLVALFLGIAQLLLSRRGIL
jgi:capsular polysaccharide transport system permease protein